jgi:hypothetical protein
MFCAVPQHWVRARGGLLLLLLALCVGGGGSSGGGGGSSVPPPPPPDACVLAAPNLVGCAGACVPRACPLALLLDPPTLALEEGGGGGASMNYTLRLSAPPDERVCVRALPGLPGLAVHAYHAPVCFSNADWWLARVLRVSAIDDQVDYGAGGVAAAVHHRVITVGRLAPRCVAAGVQACNSSSFVSALAAGRNTSAHAAACGASGPCGLWAEVERRARAACEALHPRLTSCGGGGSCVPWEQCAWPALRCAGGSPCVDVAPSPSPSPNGSACVPLDTLSCALASVDGTEDACRHAGRCKHVPGLEASLNVSLLDDDIAGFEMIGAPTGQACGEGAVYTQPSGLIEAAIERTGLPHDCAWRVACQPNQTAFLNITSISTEAGADFMQVWDGDARISQLLASISGSVLPNVSNYTSSAESISVTFTSNGLRTESAALTAAFSCGGRHQWDMVNVTQYAVEGSSFSNAGGGSYSLRLKSAPQAAVVVVPRPSQVTVYPPSATFTAWNWSQPVNFTVRAVDDLVAEGRHRGVILHDVLGTDAVYRSVYVAAVNVIVTDNDTPGVSVRQNLTALAHLHEVQATANDHYILRVNGLNASTPGVYTKKNPWPERTTHQVYARCDEPTVLSMYATDTSTGLGGIQASFNLCDSTFRTDELSWKCKAIGGKSFINPSWYEYSFDDSLWDYAKEHDLRCSDAAFYAYDGTMNETASGAPCVDWSGRESFDASHRNYCRVPVGNPYGDRRTWCYTTPRNSTHIGEWSYCQIPTCNTAPLPGQQCHATRNRYQRIETSSAVNWTTAHALAAAQGGHLATITSAAEEQCVRAVSGFTPTWIGAYRASPCCSQPPPGGSCTMLGENWIACKDKSNQTHCIPSTAMCDYTWNWVSGESWDYQSFAPQQEAVRGPAFGAVNWPDSPTGMWHSCLDGSTDCDQHAHTGYIVEYEVTYEPKPWIWTEDSVNDDHVFCRHVRHLPAIQNTPASKDVRVYTDEDGKSAEYLIQLLSQPAMDVIVDILPDRHVAVQPSAVTFYANSWDQPLAVRVQAISDYMDDGYHMGTIAHNISSADAFYNNFQTCAVVAKIHDNERFTAGVALDPTTVAGCKADPDALNYNPAATVQLPCTPKKLGCTNRSAVNYNRAANADDLSCQAAIQGCTDPEAFNFDPNATVNRGGLNLCIYDNCLGGAHNCSANATCTFLGDGLFTCACNENFDGDGVVCKPYKPGCTDVTAFNFDVDATTQLNGSCVSRVFGCINDTMFNFDPLANTDNNSCIPKIFGCMDEIALNFNVKANTDDGTCQDPYVATLHVRTGQFAEEVSWSLLDPFQSIDRLRTQQIRTAGVSEFRDTGTPSPTDPGYLNNANYSYTFSVAAGTYTFVAQGLGYGWSGTRITVIRTDGSIVFDEVPPTFQAGQIAFHDIYTFPVPCKHHAHCDKYYDNSYCAVNRTCSICNACFNNKNGIPVLSAAGNTSIDGHCPSECWSIVRLGCVDARAANFQPQATVDDGSCIPAVFGCTNPDAFDYEPLSNTPAASCTPFVFGCNVTHTRDGHPSSNYNPQANTNDGTCKPMVGGCLNPAAVNYMVPATPLLLSRGRPTGSSSQFALDTGSGNAVDGDYSRYWPNIFQAGGNGGQQWWYVHLAYPTRNPSIRLYNRDCCMIDFSSELKIFLGPTSRFQDGKLCAHLRFLGPSTNADVTCDGEGEYVTIFGIGWISFAEVEVVGIPQYPPTYDDGSCNVTISGSELCAADQNFMRESRHSNYTHCSPNATCGLRNNAGVCVCNAGLAGTGRLAVGDSSCPKYPNSSLMALSNSRQNIELGASSSGSWSDQTVAERLACRVGHLGADATWCPFVVHGCVPDVSGCTDSCALNYNSSATRDDGSCIVCSPNGMYCYIGRQVYGCTDHNSSNYNKKATRDDGSCTPKVLGCIDSFAHNFDALATTNDGSCLDPCESTASGVANRTCHQFAICHRTGFGNTSCVCSDGFVGNQSYCEPAVPGCTDPEALNFDAAANISPDNVTCIRKVHGCTNASATNFNNSANVENHSCKFHPCVSGNNSCSLFARCIITGLESYACQCRRGFIVNQSGYYTGPPGTSCEPAMLGCTDPDAFNFHVRANLDDSSCMPIVRGCTAINAINFIHSANVDIGDCIPSVYGCTNPAASNFLSNANVLSTCAPVISVVEGNISLTSASGLTLVPKENLRVALSSQPRSPVTVTLSAIFFNDSAPSMVRLDPANQLAVQPRQLFFDGGSWNQSVNVSISPIDDPDDEDVYMYRLYVSGESGDSLYAGLLDDTITFIVHDNDMAAVVVTPTSGNVRAMTETLDTVVFSLSLATRPQSNVTVTLAMDTTTIQISNTTCTFTPSNWHVGRNFSAIAVFDLIDEGDIVYTSIRFSVMTKDPMYSQLVVPDLQLRIIDDDSAVVIVSASKVRVTEGGNSSNYTMVLSSVPTADVTISLDGGFQTRVYPRVLTFTPETCFQKQTVQVDAIDDAVAESIHAGAITYRVVSNDPYYDGMIWFLCQTCDAGSSVTYFGNELSGLSLNYIVVDIIDNDAASVMVIPSAPNLKECAGELSAVVSLSSQPTAAVNVRLSFEHTERIVSLHCSAIGSFHQCGASGYCVPIGFPCSIGRGACSSLGEFEECAATGDCVPIGWSCGHNDTAVQRTLIIDPPQLLFTPQNFKDILVNISILTDFRTENTSFHKVLYSTVSDDSFYDGLTGTGAFITAEDDDIPGVDVSLQYSAPSVCVKAEHTTRKSIRVSEDGSMVGAYFLRLVAQPVNTVLVRLEFNAQLHVEPSAVVFTPGNWSNTQSVHVHAVDDNVAENHTGIWIRHSVSSADMRYHSIYVDSMQVDVVDNDIAAIDVYAAASVTTQFGTVLSIAEGHSVTYEIDLRLTSQPTSTVIVTTQASPLSASSSVLYAHDQLMIRPEIARFNQTTWNTTASLTIAAVQDDFDEPNLFYQLNHTMQSADAFYSSLRLQSIFVTVRDDDRASILLSAYTVTALETDGTAKCDQLGAQLLPCTGRCVPSDICSRYTVVLASKPIEHAVIIHIIGDNTTVAVSPNLLTFTPSMWNVPQTVNVAAVDNLIDEGLEHLAMLSHRISTLELAYQQVVVPDVTVTVVDNDVAGIVLSNSTIIVSETGGSATFTVNLNSEPRAAVIVTLSSSSQVEVQPKTLTFSAATWNVAQVIRVVAVDDNIAEGNHSVAIVHTAASSDSLYATSNATMNVSIIDNDVAGVAASPSKFSLTEDRNEYVAITLTSSPEWPVLMNFVVFDMYATLTPNQISTAPASVTFRAYSWNTSLSVLLQPIDDDLDEGNQSSYSVLYILSSVDQNYNGMNGTIANIDVYDNDNAGVALSTNATRVEEPSSAQDYTVVLASKPIEHAVIIHIIGDNTTVAVSPNLLTFTPSMWNVPQTVNVAAVDNLIDEGLEHLAMLSHRISTLELAYQQVVVPDVTVTVVDNDVAGIVLSNSTIIVSETGGSATFTVNLNSEPRAAVIVTLSSSSQVEVQPKTLTFSAATWNVAQVIRVVAVDDNIAEGNHSVAIVHTAASSDSLYATSNATMNVSIIDNDVAGVLTSINGSTRESQTLTLGEPYGSGNYTIRLASRPIGNVTLTIATSEQLMIKPATVMFPPDSWNVSASIHVSVVDDWVAQGERTLPIMYRTDSTDSMYSTNAIMHSTNAFIRVLDDDRAGLNISHSTLNVYEGGNRSIFISLQSQPVSSVRAVLVADRVHSAAAALIVNPDSVLIQPADWNLARIIALKYPDDIIVDPHIAFALSIRFESLDSSYAGVVDAANISVVDDDTLPQIVDIAPRGGPVTGDTTVIICAVGVQNYPSIGCRFGHMISTAHYINSTHLSCQSPRQSGGVQLSVTLNGQQYSTAFIHNYTFYKIPEPVRVIPNNGLVASTTQVEIRSRVDAFHGAQPMCRCNSSAFTGQIVARNVVCRLRVLTVGACTLQISLNGQDYHGNLSFSSHGTQSISWLQPASGQRNSTTLVQLHGNNFVESASATCSIGQSVVPATYIGFDIFGQAVLQCVMPALRSLGNVTNAHQFRIEASTNAQQYTQSMLSFTYTDTEPQNSFAQLPAVGVPPNTVRAEVTLNRDMSGKMPLSTHDVLSVGVSSDLAQLLQIDSDRIRIERVVGGSAVVTFVVLPASDGSALPVTGLQTSVGNARFIGGFPVAFFRVLETTSIDDANSNTAGNAYAVTVTAVSNNARSTFHDSVFAVLYHHNSSRPSHILEGQNRGNGIYTIQHMITRSGIYSMHLTVSGGHVQGSPFNVVIYPSSMHVPSCTASGAGCSTFPCGYGCIVGEQCRADITFRDRYANVMSKDPAVHFTVTFATISGSVEGTFVSANELVAPTGLSASVFFISLYKDRYAISISGNGVQIAASPFTVPIVASDPNPIESTITEGTVTIKAGESGVLYVQAVDVLKNVHERGGHVDKFQVDVTGISGSVSNSSNVTDQNNGSYGVVFTATVAGSYSVAVRLRGVHVVNSPHQFSVQPTKAHEVSTSILPTGFAEVGNTTQVAVAEKDFYGNTRFFTMDPQLEQNDRSRLAFTDSLWPNSSATPISCVGNIETNITVQVVGPLLPNGAASPLSIPLRTALGYCARPGVRGYVFQPALAGLYQISAMLAAEPVVGSPQHILVAPVPVSVTRIEPTVGPLAGGTLLSVHVDFKNFTDFLRYLQHVTDLVCVFGGTDTQPATLDAQSRTVRCASPAASSKARVVRVDVRAGEQRIVAGNVSFSYYAPITQPTMVPTLGPSKGGTPVRISHPNIIYTATTRCKFGPTIVVPQSGREGLVVCRSPSVDSAQQVQVQLSLGGQYFSSTGVPFNYYTGTLELLQLRPLLGPIAGGTVVTLHGSNIVSTAQLMCGFVLDTGLVRIPAVFVNAQHVTCISPMVTTHQNVSVHVTVNGEDFSEGLSYYYYSTVDVVDIVPRAGLPFDTGGTISLVLDSWAGVPATGIDGHALCRLGDNYTMQAHARNDTIECQVPKVSTARYSTLAHSVVQLCCSVSWHVRTIHYLIVALRYAGT